MSQWAYAAKGKWSNAWPTCQLSHTIARILVGFVFLLTAASPSVLAQESRSAAQRGGERSKPLWQFDPRVAAGSADASLNAITAPTADRIWAVGDRGLIMASQDGGRTWIQQSSGTSLNLYGVAFLSELIGFAVGGTIQPLSHSSIGIVLTTEDAGAHWQTIASGTIPRMTGITLEDQGILRTWGDYSPLLAAGVFESFDRGRSWQGLHSPLVHVNAMARYASTQPATLQRSGGQRLAVDRAGRLSRVPSQSSESLQQLSSPAVPITWLLHTGSQWIAVGHQGTLASSRDGQAWRDQPLPLSAAARAACDFRCATQVNQHIWVGGSPGSLLLHSSDGGQSWMTHTTDQTWPINCIHFFDQYRGWAVTEAGSILATRDGGKTWFTQRAPLMRLGLQAFAAVPTQVSWPALAEASWRAQQGTSLTVLHRENLEEDVDFVPDTPQAISALGVQVGLVSAEQLRQHPLPDARVRERGARSAIARNRQPASNPLIEEIAVRLRIGRPAVVLVDDLPSGTRQSSDIAEAMVQALQLAASGTAEHAWLQQELHLPPWQVNKLVGTNPTHKPDFTISVDGLLRDSGIAIQDAIAPVIGLSPNAMQNVSLHCLQLNQPNSAARNSLFHAAERHADATRAVELSNVGNFQLVMGRTHLQKAWQSLQPSAINVNEPHQSWLDKKLDFIIDASPKHEVGPALVNLVQAHLQAAQWERWYSILDRGANYAPQSDFSRWCVLQQLQYGASDERLAWQRMQRTSDTPDDSPSSAGSLASRTTTDAWNSTPFESSLPQSKGISGNQPLLKLPPPAGNSRGADLATSGAASGPVQPAVAYAERDPLASTVQASAGQASTVPASEGQAGGVRPASASAAVSQPVDSAAMLGDISQRVAACRRAVDRMTALAQSDRGLSLRPDIQLAQVARRRALAEFRDEPQPDSGVYQNIISGMPLAGWQQVADQELALASGRKTLSAWTARARATSERPRLDGRKSDPCWQHAAPIELTSPFAVASSTAATTARFSYDSEYLYVLLECPRVPTESPTTRSPQPRRYDMDLNGSDHVHLWLDTDRDYTSACELGVNSQGHTFDRCCDSAAWNPRWYVAVDSADNQWTAELAIGLSDLTTCPTAQGRAWAISAFRYIPGVDVFSWSQLRSYNPRHQGCGLLLFDPE